MEGPSSHEAIHEERDVRALVASACRSLDARAAGCWRMDPSSNRLVLLAFVAGDGLDPEVARAFAEATRAVEMGQTSLGIVAAATRGRPLVSRAEDLPTDSGSGRWLRAFGAARSVAVPVLDRDGQVVGVFSVALPAGSATTDELVADQLARDGSVLLRPRG